MVKSLNPFTPNSAKSKINKLSNITVKYFHRLLTLRNPRFHSGSQTVKVIPICEQFKLKQFGSSLSPLFELFRRSQPFTEIGKTGTFI